jgi:hypothetical protein
VLDIASLRLKRAYLPVVEQGQDGRLLLALIPARKFVGGPLLTYRCL